MCMCLCIILNINGFSLLCSHKTNVYTSIRLAASDGISIGSDTEGISDKCGPCPLAPKCKGEYRNNKLEPCDGTGKIQGGIATVPLLSWWPIKVFRPCPSYIAAGYVYRREGQTMDQVLFSEPSNKMKAKLQAMRELELEELAEDRKKQQSTDLSDADKFLSDKFNKRNDR